MDTREELKTAFYQWVQPRLDSYEEPSRIGVHRGDPIGLSKQKYFAAQAQVLHSKFTLAEIADVVGVKPVQVRVWRTQMVFNQVAQEALEDFKNYLFGNFLNWEADTDKFFKKMLCLSTIPDSGKFINKQITSTVREHLIHFDWLNDKYYDDMLKDLRIIQFYFETMFQVLSKHHPDQLKTTRIGANLKEYLYGIVDMFKRMMLDAPPELIKDKMPFIGLILTTISEISLLFA
ncbi:MAG: hypothetical protein A2139_06190 [Desulfobacca sp. RBG_16_60_12]|nr:MAG: hypothetical protein A2139_06190 [Desulfobacca sp. RBG_16_60_12]